MSHVAATQQPSRGTGKQARPAARHDREHEPVRGHDAAVDPREPALDREVVQEVARREVVRAVEQEVGAPRELGEVVRVEVVRVDLDARRPADARERFPRGLDLRRAVVRVALVEEDLARQVRELDDVAVDEHEPPDAAAHERLRERAAERADADDEHAPFGEPLLTYAAERREAHLALEPAQGVLHAPAPAFAASTKPQRIAPASAGR